MKETHRHILRKKRRFIAVVLVVASILITTITGAFVFYRNQGNVNYVLKEAFPALIFDHPVGVYYAGDGSHRLFVVEQSGIIYSFINESNATNKQVFLDLRSKVISGGELGLLGVAFHPNFKDNGYFYIDYTADSPLRTVISRFSINTLNKSTTNTSSELVLLEIAQPYVNHNGGQLAFGPDGFLYVGMGDGGSEGDPLGNGQNKSTLLGKILRIDVNGKNGSLNYGIPLNNPFMGNSQGYREEIYAFGLRNPWRFSFDISTSTLWCGDVGQDAWEEIDIIESGGNYGWNIMEGKHCYSPATGCDQSALLEPVWEYGHDVGECIIGGVIYRGTALPQLVGDYIYGDYITGKIWSLNLHGTTVENSTLIVNSLLNLTSINADAAGEILIVAFDGKIYMISTN